MFQSSRIKASSQKVWDSKLVSISQVVLVFIYVHLQPLLWAPSSKAHRPTDACKIFFICPGLEKLLVTWSQAPVDTCESSPLVLFCCCNSYANCKPVGPCRTPLFIVSPARSINIHYTSLYDVYANIYNIHMYYIIVYSCMLHLPGHPHARAHT